MDYQRIEVREEGLVLVLRIPGGALDARTAEELDDAFAQLVEDRGHRVVVVESAAPDFCTGADRDLDRAAGTDPPGRMAALHLPVVVAVVGQCHSAGLELALGADIRIASPGSRLSLPDVTTGGLSRWGGVQLLTRAVGAGAATPMVLLGRELEGAAAFEAGLVHELADDPSARARAVAAELSERGPLALEYAKEAVRRGAELPLVDALRLEADFNHLLQASQDRAEGLQAFFDKRDPRFEGR